VVVVASDGVAPVVALGRIGTSGSGYWTLHTKMKIHEHCGRVLQLPPPLPSCIGIPIQLAALGRRSSKLDPIQQREGLIGAVVV
jgi:hypothetical protein